MSPVTRYLLLACGWLFVGLGAIGMLLPIIPTVPFLLLAAACFARSSGRLHRWLLDHPTFGPLLRDYEAGLGLSAKAKAVSITTMWISIGVSTVFFVPYLVADVIMLAAAVAATIYLLLIPTARI